jgi:hypothetical protein
MAVQPKLQREPQFDGVVPGSGSRPCCVDAVDVVHGVADPPGMLTPREHDAVGMRCGEELVSGDAHAVCILRRQVGARRRQQSGDRTAVESERHTGKCTVNVDMSAVDASLV